MRLHAIERQRAALQHLRRSGKISDETDHRLQEEIDWAELNASPPDRFEPLAT
jgi:CPA1 family monovalent cation:H+ antiporter